MGDYDFPYNLPDLFDDEQSDDLGWLYRQPRIVTKNYSFPAHYLYANDHTSPYPTDDTEQTDVCKSLTDTMQELANISQ